MFFTLSKIFWFFANPGNLLLFLIGVGVVALFMQSWKLGRRLLGIAFIISLFIAIVPVGKHLLYRLENHFPQVTLLPPHIDGIVVLGGFSNQFITKSRGQVALGGAVERLIESAMLTRKYPKAKLVISGGSGNLMRQEVKEAEALRPVFKVLGLDINRIIFESKSRNTHENALYSKEIAKPKPGQKWMLVTSASHMPRAVGSFRKVGWKMIPYPVDYNVEGTIDLEVGFNFLSGLSALNQGLHEWIGLFVYKFSGYIDSYLPPVR
jgi:uncharacterized SAM-binding protein YcdF (DUF218 family)